MQQTINLQQETVLTINTTSTGVSLTRLSDNAGGVRDNTSVAFNNISIISDRTLEIGPFAETRRYAINGTESSYSHSTRRERLSFNHQGTGILSGGILSVNGGDSTKFDISAGTGVVVDNYTDPQNPQVITISWPDLSELTIDALATDFVTHVSVDQDGAIVQQTTPLTSNERRDCIQLGLLIHTNLTSIQSLEVKPQVGYDQAHMLIDLADSLGIVNKSGNIFSANGTNLKVDKSSGESFSFGSNWDTSTKSPNMSTDLALSGPTMFRSYRDGSGGWAIPVLSNLVDVGKYDDGTGTLNTMSGVENFQIFRIFYAPANQDVIIAYGQQTYLKMADAQANIDGEDFSKNPILDSTILRGYLIAKRDTTDLSDTTEAKLISLDKLGSSAAGGANFATTTLQGAYENSGDTLGEIVTNSTNEGLTIRDGTNNADNLLYCGRNYANTHVYGVNGCGQVKGSFLTVTTAGRPGSPRDYQFYFDTTLGIPVWYDGTNWVDATGGTV